MIAKFLLLLNTSMEYNQWLHDVLYKFSSLDNYRDSIHYWDSFIATIVIVKFLLLLSTTFYYHANTNIIIATSHLYNRNYKQDNQLA